ncbi:MAG: hypothetical protein U0893_12005 [Chloroflexota bacterium]
MVAWLFSLPFGKFFHIVQRPYLHRRDAVSGGEPGRGRHGPEQRPPAASSQGGELPSEQFIADLKTTLADLGQQYQLGDGQGVLQDYCPTCKRILRGQAYYRVMGNRARLERLDPAGLPPLGRR